MNRWYVVQTHSMREEIAAINLRRQGYVVYLPRYLKKRSHARRVDWVAKPLFPRYLFVEMDAEATPWRAICSTIGVTRFICLSDMPAPVPIGVVEEIIARENEEGYVEFSSEFLFKKGQTLEITNGPMAEISAVFECVNDKDRITVLMDLMGRQIRVLVPLDAVQAIA
jgi:transcriptional antiterminator RfaH